MENPLEVPQEEVKEEVSEVSEESQRVDKATFEPEAFVEGEGDFKEAEAVEAAFVDAVKAVETVPDRSADEVSATPITLPSEDSEPRPKVEVAQASSADEGSKPDITVPEATYENLDIGKEGKPPDEGATEPAVVVAEEIQAASVEVKDTAETAAVVKEATADRIRENDPTLAEQVHAEQVPVAEAAAQQEAQVIPDQHDGDGGYDDRIIVNLDGSDDGPQLDTGGVEEVIDLHKPNQVKDGFDPTGGMQGGAQADDVGYQDPGSAFGLEDPSRTHDVPEAGPGGGPPGRDIPGLPGQDDMEGWAERPDLRGAAAAGGDPRVGADTGDKTAAQIAADKAAADQAAADQAEADQAAADQDAADQAAADQAAADQAADGKAAADFAANNPEAAAHMGKLVGRVDNNPVKTTAGRIWKQMTAMYTTADKASSAHVGVRGTPNPDAVDGEFDDTLGGLVPGIVPDASPDDLGAESLMQPVGENDSNRERPRENLKEAMAGGDVDPLAQYTDEHVDLPKVVPDSVDTDDSLVDPPEMIGGGDVGFIETDSDKNREDGLESSDLENLDGIG